MDVATEVPGNASTVPTKPKRRRRDRSVESAKRRKAPSKACYLTLGHIDQRSEAWRRANQLIAILESERGGPDHITESQRQLWQRAGVLAAVIENMEALWVAGESIDMAGYLSAIGVQRRVLITLGIERQQPKDVTTSLGSYLSERKDGADGE